MMKYSKWESARLDQKILPCPLCIQPCLQKEERWALDLGIHDAMGFLLVSGFGLGRDSLREGPLPCVP